MAHRALAALAGIVALAGSAAPCTARAEAPDAGALVIDARTLPRFDDALARYRKIQTDGGWQALADGRTLRPGDRGPDVAALRERLLRTGDLRGVTPGEPGLFTPALDRAVRDFQLRHGLVPDGVVGRGTRAALNVPAAQRVATLALNRDRLADLAKRVPASAVVVNVPAFALTLATRGQVLLQSRVIVGKPSSPTPTLDSRITRVEINPYWNVPPSIARRELAPKIAADPGYLAANHMQVLAGPNGQSHQVDPATVDWRHFGAAGVRLRQDPGPDNPLGNLKFFFPNDHDVYLHDTPAKQAFQRPVRALSHGCVRVENAFTLATLLLGGNSGWTEERLRVAIATGAYQKVDLAQPMAVYIVYVTAWVDPEGAVEFRPDIYRRDGAPPPAAMQKACTVEGPVALPG